MSTPTVAVIDNYDSFTYNLVHYLAELGADPRVFRNDETTIDELAGHDLLVISPGPCTPTEAGISMDAVKSLSGAVPILGVCLGHQSIGAAFGADVVRTAPVHGKTARITHDDTGVLSGLPDPFTATRYHSLVVDPASFPPELVPNAWVDGLVMGLRHREHPTFGVQFHPESVLSTEGKQLIANFLECAND
ncbi:aminodeoxychorismate/anthranilate synthase component II [Actinosynnema sp. ALI-1.44]|uniref:anthranilate synthase component II n=1 Tax=Actinosynnema sp. ALI-1.44 TaxID=1933779 RepID=UPI00097C1BBF|nr:aminodeoxychorismate/anthranilate synthase component II [Actinosynnema sp. ALI-1.44]ONI82917.1 aminodeoxychorismate/anthranilate synthase component II [Actinosynnema sp. ALI-1.44]